MTEPSAPPSAPPEWYSKPPAWMTQSPPSQQPHYSPPNTAGSNADVLQALAAMPEKLVNAIREATKPVQQPPAQQAPGQQQQQQQPPAQQQQQQDTPPAKPSFAEWWFNK